MTTAEQQDLIDRIAHWLEADPAVEALWLAGSLGKGGGDPFSDVDLLVLAADGAAAELSAKLARTLDEVVRPVLVNSLYSGRVLNVVTEEWRRFDLTFVQREDLQRYNALDLTAIFNRTGVQPPARPYEAYRTPPAELLKLVNEFLRVFGLLPVAVGREEYELALSGIDLMRRMTFDLMLEENGIAPPRRGGALHRNPLLTDEQQKPCAACRRWSANAPASSRAAPPLHGSSCRGRGGWRRRSAWSGRSRSRTPPCAICAKASAFVSRRSDLDVEQGREQAVGGLQARQRRAQGIGGLHLIDRGRGRIAAMGEGVRQVGAGVAGARHRVHNARSGPRNSVQEKLLMARPAHNLVGRG